MRFYDGKFLIFDTETKFRADEVTLEELEALGGPDQVKLRMHESADVVMPYIPGKKIIGEPNQLTLTDWMYRAVLNPVDAPTVLQQILDAKGVTLTEEEFTALVEIPVNCAEQKKRGVRKEFLAYATGDPSAVRNIKSRVIENDIQYRHPNKTSVQKSNTDKVSIRLPDAEVIISHELGTAYRKTGVDTSFSPYPNKLYTVKHIINILSADSASKRVKQIVKVIDILRSEFGVDLDEGVAKKLIGSFEVLPTGDVFGYKENDTVGIMDNERPFYENLVDFIKWHIYEFNKELMSNSTQEEVQEKSDTDFKTGVLPLRLREYLGTLLFDTLTKQFSHTGNFNIEQDMFDEDDDTRDEDAQTERDSYKVMISKADPRSSDLNIQVENYLDLSAKQFSAAVWAEGIIKLLRWGDRKVESLCVGENNLQYFDIYKMDIITKETADLAGFVPEVDEDGRSLIPLGLAHVEFNPRDESRRYSYPFVFAAYEVGSLPGVEEKVKPLSVMTLFDIVRSYTTGNSLIQGLQFDGQKFYYEYDEELTEFELTSFSKKKVFVLEELYEFAISNGISRVTGIAAAIFNQEDLREYADGSPLLERLTSIPKQLRNNAVQGGLVDIFQEAAQDNEELKIGGLLNWYFTEVYSAHLKGYCRLFGYDLKETQQVQPSKINTRNVETANFFGVTDESNVSEVGVEGEEFVYKEYAGKEKPKFDKIMHTVAGVPTIVGAYATAVEGGQEVPVFAGVSEIDGFAASAAEVSISKVVVRLYEAAMCADPRNEVESKVRTVTQYSVGLIYKAMRGL